MDKIVTARISDPKMLAWLKDQDNISDTIRRALRAQMQRECMVPSPSLVSGNEDTVDRVCEVLEGIRLALEHMGAGVVSVPVQSVNEDPEAQKSFDRMIDAWGSGDSYA